MLKIVYNEKCYMFKVKKLVLDMCQNLQQPMQLLAPILTLKLKYYLGFRNTIIQFKEYTVSILDQKKKGALSLR